MSLKNNHLRIGLIPIEIFSAHGQAKVFPIGVQLNDV